MKIHLSGKYPTLQLHLYLRFYTQANEKEQFIKQWSFQNSHLFVGKVNSEHRKAFIFYSIQLNGPISECILDPS